MNNYMLTCLDSEQKKSLSFDTISDHKKEVANQHILYIPHLLNKLKISEIPKSQI